MSQSTYPHEDGDTIVIGPQCFAAKDGEALNWRGENYYPTVPWHRIEEAIYQAVGAGAAEIMRHAPRVVMPTDDVIRRGQEIVASLRKGEIREP